MTNTLHFFIESGKLMVMEHVPEEMETCNSECSHPCPCFDYKQVLQKAKQSAIEVDNKDEVYRSILKSMRTGVQISDTYLERQIERYLTVDKIYSLEGCKMEVKRVPYKGFSGGGNSYDEVALITFEEPKKYPIGGYAPGNYNCKCLDCKTIFQGDKRAVQCESCAVDMIGEKEPKSIIKRPVFFTRGQIWDASGKKVCNVPNGDDHLILGDEIVSIINHFKEPKKEESQEDIWESLIALVMTRRPWSEVKQHFKIERITMGRNTPPEQWIPVSERLPEDSGRYLVRTTTKDTLVSWYHVLDYQMDDNCKRQWYAPRTDQEMYVTHWMPLPPPPNISNI